jgi:hypothetical protein
MSRRGPPGWWITADPVLCASERAAAIGIALDRAGVAAITIGAIIGLAVIWCGARRRAVTPL